LRKINVFILTFYKLHDFIVGGHFIEHFFGAFLTPMSDHISLPFAIIHPDRSHESVTLCESISWLHIIDMFRVEAVRTVIARRSSRVDGDFSPAMFARE
jgi:hypothetical protein